MALVENSIYWLIDAILVRMLPGGDSFPHFPHFAPKIPPSVCVCVCVCVSVCQCVGV